MAIADQWLTKCATLHVYRARGGPAPHKPLLLLCVLQLAENAALPLDDLELTPELAFLFSAYWTIVAHRRTQRPDVRFPFHHLQTDRFWLAMQANHQPSPDPKLTRFARLDPDFAQHAQDPDFRNKARGLLIQSYFTPEERLALFSLVGMAPPKDDEMEQRMADARVMNAQRQGREARFRLVVVPAYNYACALTGYRLTTVSAGSIVDAAHIHRFADSRNNDPQNGIALSKNAHWLFDCGLWTLDDDFSVMVAQSCFVEESPDQKSLSMYQGQRLRLPTDRNLWPDPAHLGWHRRNRFLGE